MQQQLAGAGDAAAAQEVAVARADAFQLFNRGVLGDAQ